LFFLLVGLIFAFLIAASASVRPLRSEREALGHAQREEEVETIIGVFLLLVIALGIAIDTHRMLI
jgi:hypothetical protein